jgi:hypothetical protein
VRVAERTAERLKGIMLERRLPAPLLIPFDREGRRANAIHALFCLAPFDAIFLDGEGRVVDLRPRIAPFTPLITPRRACRYVLETPAGESRRVRPGDRLQFRG